MIVPTILFPSNTSSDDDDDAFDISASWLWFPLEAVAISGDDVDDVDGPDGLFASNSAMSKRVEQGGDSDVTKALIADAMFIFPCPTRRLPDVLLSKTFTDT